MGKHSSKGTGDFRQPAGKHRDDSARAGGPKPQQDKALQKTQPAHRAEDKGKHRER